MKRVVLALALTAAVLGPTAAHAATSFGVTEDAGKYSADGGAAFFSRLRDLGMTQNAVSVQWNPDRPNVILERSVLDRMVPTATRFGIRIVFAVYFTRPSAVTSRPGGSAEFAAFLRTLARAYPQVKDFVVGNEPNYGVFWQPQFAADGTPAAGAAYEELLARSYDALKSVDPRINVIGLGLAARGNDDPASPTPSTSPILFLRDVGVAYRRSRRTRPLMDSLAYHPYPASSLDRVETKQRWPSAGVADLGRLKQAVWDAFHDTAQSTFETGLSLKITEIGWQAAIPAGGLNAYRGTETVRTTDEARQAGIYAQLVRDLACDPAVTDVLFFHLIDETDLGGFQSGLIRADGTPRRAYAAVQKAIAESGGHCTRSIQQWSHTEDVVGASVGFGQRSGLGFTATVQEGALFRAAVLPVDGTPTSAERVALEHSFGRATDTATSGAVPAYGQVAPRLEAPSVPGTYVQAVLVSAAADPSRTSFFVSDPFTVATGSGRAESAQEPLGFALHEGEPDGSSGGSEFSASPTSQNATTPAPRSRAEQGGTHAAAGPTSAEFRTLPHSAKRLPAASSGDTPDEGEPAGSAVASAAPASLDPREPRTMLPYVVALLLVGSALLAVVAIRLLRR